MNKRQRKLVETLKKLDHSHLYQKRNSTKWMISFDKGLHRIRVNIMVHEVLELERMGVIEKMCKGVFRRATDKPEFVIAQ